MEKKGSILGFIFIFIIAFSVVVPDIAQAVPAFARQTGLACSLCHFQHFPTLNAIGRAFKAGGFTMVGGQSMVEGDMLSLPSVINASTVIKLRYQKRNGDSSTGMNMGELNFPDEASFFLGGRVGENIGFLLESSLIPGETTVKDSANGDMTVPETNLFTSFKMPFVYDLGNSKISVIPFTTDSLGAAFGFELLNTGAVSNIRIIEHGTDLSAQQFVGMDSQAEGVAFVVANNNGFVNATIWTPNHGSVAINSPAYYLRAVATPTLVEGWDIGAGVQYWTGTVSRDAAGGGDEDTKAWAIDAQAQGTVGSMPLGIYLTDATANKASGSTPNLFNSNPKDRTAFTVNAELGVIPKKTTVTVGFRSGDTGAASKSKDNAVLLGLLHQVTQNIQLQANHSIYSGSKYDAATKAADGDQLTTLLMFAAF